jgi:diguanylate cyclase (GGDEF)-like protein/putative nucleotidyltransferase with HDIG domain
LPWQIWWQVHRRTLFPELALATIGILAAVCWKFDGILLPLFAVPVVVLGAAFRAIAAEDRTRALRRRSEQLEAVLAAGQHLRLEHSQVELLRAVAEAARTIVKASAVGAYWPAQNDPATLERVVLLPGAPSLLSADEAGPTHLPLPAPGSGMQIVGADSSVPALLVPLEPDGVGMSGLLRVAGVPAELPDADRDTLAILATQAAIALENTYLHQRALAQASTDGLTGLLNHRTFQVRLQEEVERAQRSDYSLALIMVDLDDFGSINNRYGHLAGDAALKAVATILNENTRNGDIAARYGGDEFAVILPEAAMGEALAIAERIHAEVATCRIAEGRILIRVNASLGVAALPDHATTREELVRVADQASYAAKNAGKGRVGRPEDALRLLDRDPEILAQQLANANLATVEALAAAVDARDPYTLGHAQRVSTYAQILAQAMDLPAADVKRVQMAGLLHDIGKIGIPDAILTKPELLTPDEFDIIKQHPVIGARMLTAVPFLRDILPAVRHHHERWDGLGYPDGLAGADIPEDASIVMVADALDAMATSRTYRLALPWPEVCRRIQDGSGAQFDPRVVRAFERAISDGTLTAPLEEGSAARTEQLLRAG